MDFFHESLLNIQFWQQATAYKSASLPSKGMENRRVFLIEMSFSIPISIYVVNQNWTHRIQRESIDWIFSYKVKRKKMLLNQNRNYPFLSHFESNSLSGLVQYQKGMYRIKIAQKIMNFRYNLLNTVLQSPIKTLFTPWHILAMYRVWDMVSRHTFILEESFTKENLIHVYD